MALVTTTRKFVTVDIPPVRRGRKRIYKDARSLFMSMGASSSLIALISVGIQAAVTDILHKNVTSVSRGSYGAGIWCGAIFLATGLTSYFLGRRLQFPLTSPRHHRSHLAALFGLSIVALPMSVVLIIFGSWTVEDLYRSYEECDHSNWEESDTEVVDNVFVCDHHTTVGLGAVLIIVGILELGVFGLLLLRTGYYLCHSKKVNKIEPAPGLPTHVAYVMQVPGPHGSHAAHTEHEVHEMYLTNMHGDGYIQGANGPYQFGSAPPGVTPSVQAMSLSPSRLQLSHTSLPVTGPVAESATEPITEPTTELEINPVTDPVIEPAVGPVVELGIEPGTDAVSRPVTESVTEPVTEVFEPVAPPEPTTVDNRASEA